MKRRYVILRHEFPDGHERESHWDLMLEMNDHLMTWALEAIPSPDSFVEAIALPDHRKAYLDYEGEVSNQRGSVKRVDSGIYIDFQETETSLCFRLQSDSGATLTCQTSKVAVDRRCTFEFT